MEELINAKDCCIHFFSYENDFIQALVYVDETDVASVKKALDAGLDLFYEDTSWCWGEAFDSKLSALGIPYEIALCDFDVEECVPTEAWETLVDKEAINPEHRFISYGYRS